MPMSSLIKYEGDNTTFIWKHPCEDFNTTTQLIVSESQEAIFFMNGLALDLFGAGRHTLETQNVPLVNKFFNKATGDDTPFHCQVYFINKTEQMAIKWGTDSKVQYVEPTYKFPIYIGASGEMAIRVEDSRKLLVKLVGTEQFLDQQKLVGYFRAILMTKVKTYIAQVMKVDSISVFEIDEHLVEFSEELQNRLIPDFMNYGVSLERFFVTTIVKPDGDSQYERFKELHFRQYADITEAKIRQQVGVIDQQTEAQKMVIEAQGFAQKRVTEGYTYQQERGFDVAEKVAQNEGTGNFSSTGIGLGIMTGIGGAVGGVVGNAFNDSVQAVAAPAPAPQAEEVGFCENCGASLSKGAFFCDKCGTPQSQNKASCKKCGFIFEKEGKFCPKCGTNREV
jgi:membrane protease subunit (stomatin/prohibitin family)